MGRVKVSKLGEERNAPLRLQYTKRERAERRILTVRGEIATGRSQRGDEMVLPITFTAVALRYMEFLGYFAIYGALGFRFLVLRLNAVWAESNDSAGIATICESAQRSAARIGLIGAALLLLELTLSAIQNASKAHPGALDAALHPGPKILIQFALGVVALVAFAGALRSISGAWALAGIAGAGFVLRNVGNWRWTSLMNPLHEAGAALWLGTLFVLVVVGLPALLTCPLPRDRRGKLVAELVATFSPLALAGAGLMALTGVITSWTHLKRVSALWKTSYGVTLDVKLGVVALVVVMGAWNWRRIAPSLQAEETAAALRRSSTTELVFAAVVLLLTAILVLLPSPN
jgi:putative copper export protein